MCGKGFGIHKKHERVCFEERAFDIYAFLEKAINTRTNLHLARALGIADELEADGRIFLDHGERRDLDWTFSADLRPLLLTASDRPQDQQAECQPGKRSASSSR